MSKTRVHWAIAFLIGLATVTATTFGWRAAQIGSTAAYEDRQSISETIAVEEEAVALRETVTAQAREYARYLADYRVAAALDREAVRLAQAGSDALARVSRSEAVALRLGATRRAAEAGVFGRSSIGDEVLTPRLRPRPFDVQERTRALAAERSASLDSPGNLDPDRWARSAEEIRVRINGLVRWSFVLLVSVLLYTLAEVSQRWRAVVGLTCLGLVVYVVGLVGGLTTVFFG